MPRPLRIEFPGACSHVICRGNARLPILESDEDKALLLDRMVHYAELFHVDIRAYCVMINHVHIHLRMREANLGAYMRSFLTSFTSTYNHRHASYGHVFQGRYRAFLIEDVKPYRSKVTRYIHLNPGCIPSLVEAPFEVRHNAALQYPWSSYGPVLGLRPCAPWLDRNAVLKGWGGNLAEKRGAYRAFVESDLLAGITDPAEEAAAHAVLGGTRFLKRVKRGLSDHQESLDVRREASQHRKLASWHSLDEVIRAVGAAYGRTRTSLLRRHNRGCEARQVLLYLAATQCRGRYSLSELGQALGPITLSAVSNARANMVRRMDADAALKKRVMEIMKSLDSVPDSMVLED